MTTRYDFPPHPIESSQADRPPMPLPWMPLDALVELWAQARIPLVYETLEPLPPELDLSTLIGSALLQRERVWTIAHALLVEQVRHYRDLLTEGIFPSSTDRLEDEVQA